MLFYPATLALSRQTLDYTAGIIRRHRKQIGSPWRKLGPGQQALLVLAYLRKGETFAELAAGFGVGTATAWRYVTETCRGRLPGLRSCAWRCGTRARPGPPNKPASQKEANRAHARLPAPGERAT